MSALIKVFAFVFCLSFLARSCGNEKDEKLLIGERLSGVKFLESVPGSDDLFFAVNTNNYNLYLSGSLQVYSKGDLKKPLLTKEIPSFATSIRTYVAENAQSYLVLTFEPETSKVDPEIIIWPYSLTDQDGEEVFAFGDEKYSYTLKSSPKETLPENEDPKSLLPIATLIKRVQREKNGPFTHRLAISCNRGQLLVMDLFDGDPSKWKAPVHVRSFGKYAKREALIATQDDLLLAFPAFSDEAKKEFLTEGHDKKMKKEEGFNGPKSELTRKESLRRNLSPYQLVVFDLREELNFVSYRDDVNQYLKETAWLSFDMDGEVKGKDDEGVEELYYRTNFLRAMPASDAADNKTFYVSQRSSLLNVSVKNQIHKLTVKADLRDKIGKAGITKEEGKEDEVVEIDLDETLIFDKKPAFLVKDDDSRTTSKDPRVYSLFDFRVTTAESDSKPVRFAAISYNYKKKFYLLLEGEGTEVSRKYEERSTSKSYWALAYWEKDKTYVTVKNAYKAEAELVSGKF